MAFSVFSWNILKKSKHQIRDVEAMLTAKPDVLCLQEVREETKEALRDVPEYQYFEAVDALWNREPVFLGIMIRRTHEVLEHTVGAHNHEHRVSPSFFGTVLDWVGFVESQSVKVRVGDDSIRIANFRLGSGDTPPMRRAQLDEILKTHPGDAPRVLCGDYNSMGRPLINAAAVFYGITLDEFLVDERRACIKFLGERGLKTAFPKRKVTHPITRGDLDHIFFERSLHLVGAKVHKKRHHSDHSPVRAEFELKRG